ncbi:MAG: MFS transporter [Actinomycetota bacterium]
MALASLHGAQRQPASPSTGDRPPRRGLILATLSACMVMVAIDTSAVNVALDDMQAELNMSIGELAWVINAYTLTWACLTPVGGRIGDLRGRRGGLLGGATVFVAASIASGMAPNAAMVIAARTVQGAGAAFMFPANLALVSATFPDRERPRAIATLITVVGGGQAAGPLIGGALVETLGWRALFFINLPIGAVAIFYGLRLVPRSRADSEDRSIDWIGAALITSGLVGLVVAIDQSDGWPIAATLAVAGAGVVLLAVFVIVEYRVNRPLIGPELLTNRNVQALNLAGIAMFFTFLPTLMYGALLVQNIFGYSAVEAGAALVPFVLPIALIARPAAALAERWDTAKVMSLGYVCIVVGLGAFALLLSEDMSIVAVLVPLSIAGLGFGTCIALISSTVVGSVSPDDAGTASGANFAIRLIGGTIGVAIVTNVFDGRGGGTDVEPTVFVDAVRPAFVLLAIVAAVGLAINVGFVRDDRRLAP